MTRWVSLLFVAMLAAGCEKKKSEAPAKPPAATGSPSPGPSTQGPANIVVITVDTTRADRIGCYGWSSARTPRIDSLAAGGVRFAKAYSSAPLTLPSHASLFTGVHPQVHGCRVNAAESLGKAIPFMPELMKRNGYATGAFVSAFVLHDRFGLSRGFDIYDDALNAAANHETTSHAERRGDFTCDAALAWLEQHGADRIFVWMHLFDPHTPYAAPPPFGDGKDPYDGEIAFADVQIDRLLKWFEKSGKFEDTLVVIAGDHGESLGEHGEPTHGVLLHDSTLHVPLILHWPKEYPKGRTVEANVELVDVFPTVLEAAGIAGVEGLNGKSLRASWEGTADSERLVYSESEYPWRSYGWSPLKSVVRGHWRYVEAPQRELYDRQSDPGESNNIVDTKQELADELRERLYQMTSQFKAFEATPVAADSTARSMLNSLGYVGAGAADEVPTGSLKDPKTMMEIYGMYVRGQALLDAGKPQEALPLFESVLKETPESDELYVSLGKIYLMLGRSADAEQAIIKSLRKHAEDPFKLWVLGESLRRQQKDDKAIECFKKVVQIMPDMAEGHRSLALIFSGMRDFQSAYEPCRRFAELNPNSAAAWTNFGNVCLALRRIDEAIPSFEKALQLDPKSREAHRSISQALLFSKRRLDAIAAMRRTLDAFPDEESMKTPLVWLIGITNGMDASALDAGLRLGLEQVAKSPNDARALDALAAVCAAMGRFDDAMTHARKAADAAAAAGDADLAGKIGARIQLYSEGRPFRSE